MSHDHNDEVEPYFDLRAAETDDHKGDDSVDLKEALDAEDMGEGIKHVRFGDPELAGGIRLGEFYVHRRRRGRDL